jgi:hypothetical protein
VPFGLINAGETFQRAIDVSFWGLINKCVVVYLDDVTVYSKNIEDHIQHLTQIFERCRKYGISLNPKKTIFGVEEREKEKSKFIAHQKIVKRWFDEHKAKENNFEVGDLVLKWDKVNEPKGKHSKFQNLWLRTFPSSRENWGRHVSVSESEGGT